MKKTTKHSDLIVTKTQSLIEDFIALLDSIFYEGYAEQLCAHYPEQFNQQLNEYLEQYSVNN